tara:strand:- start:8444 stop:8764 length:321 start_codon:yes stop_codon:yes gene_type:complete
MTAPNLGTFNVHAAGKVTAETATLADGVNTVGVTRTGLGVYVINLGTEIDDTVRHTSVQARFASAGIVQLNPAVQTDSTVGVLAFTAAGAAADIDFEYLVQRAKVI